MRTAKDRTPCGVRPGALRVARLQCLSANLSCLPSATDGFPCTVGVLGGVMPPPQTREGQGGCSRLDAGVADVGRDGPRFGGPDGDPHPPNPHGRAGDKFPPDQVVADFFRKEFDFHFQPGPSPVRRKALEHRHSCALSAGGCHLPK